MFFGNSLPVSPKWLKSIQKGFLGSTSSISFVICKFDRDRCFGSVNIMHGSPVVTRTFAWVIPGVPSLRTVGYALVLFRGIAFLDFF